MCYSWWAGGVIQYALQLSVFAWWAFCVNKMYILCCISLLFQATDGFLFVVQCDTGCVIYVSDSVTPVLSYSQVSKLLVCNNKHLYWATHRWASYSSVTTNTCAEYLVTHGWVCSCFVWCYVGWLTALRHISTERLYVRVTYSLSLNALYGVSKTNITKLQRMQNNLAHVVCKSPYNKY